MALKFKARFPKVDKKATEDLIDKVFVDAVIEALRQWVIGTTNVVPVWSGASKASFLKLASEARTSLSITPAPKAPNRIQLGIETSKGQILKEKGKKYGWIWESDLSYIGIVNERSRFIETGIQILRNLKPPELPPPVMREG